MTALIDGTKETFYQLTTSEWLTLCNQLNLSFAAMKVLMYLRTINPWGDRKVEAETKDLAKALNLNIRTVQRCLHELDDKKLIEIEFNRFKFTLKSHVATSTSLDDQNVATSTSLDDQNVATSTSLDDQNVATSTSLDDQNVAMSRHPCRQDDTQIAKTTSMSRSPSKSTDAQGFQEPSYSSYSSYSLKTNNPPISPQGGTGVVANAFQEEEGEQEPIAHEPKLPEQNTTSQKNANAVKDQSSAPRRRSPSKATQKIQRAYSVGVPPWRYGYGLNEYHDWFVRYARQKHQELPENSYYKKSFSPVGLIAFRESKGEFEELQQRCDEAWEIEAKRQAAEAALAAQTIAAAQPEEPREMPMDAIARIMQAQGLTPADVLPEVKSEYRAVFNRLPSDPQEAWDLLSRAQLSIVATFLEKQYATP